MMTRNNMTSTRMLFGAGVTLVVALALGYSAYLTISAPFSARDLKLDERRVNDLQQLQSGIEMDYQNQQPPRMLPKRLEDLTQGVDTTYLRNILQDPETQEPYRYRKVGDLQYEL